MPRYSYKKVEETRGESSMKIKEESLPLGNRAEMPGEKLNEEELAKAAGGSLAGQHYEALPFGVADAYDFRGERPDERRARSWGR